METPTRMRIDTHVHLLPPGRLDGLLRWMRRSFPEHPIEEGVSLELLRSELREAGVERIFNLVYPLDRSETGPLNRFNLELAERWPEIVPFGSLHPDDPRKDEIVVRLLEEFGFVGIKFHPFVQKFDPFSEIMVPVFRTLNSYRRPLVIHTGYEEFYGGDLPVRGFRELASRYPDMPLVLVHMLFPHLDEAFRMLGEFPQVYLDATNVFGSLKMMRAGMEPQDVAPIERNLLACVEEFKGRVFFGSDHPAGMGDLSTIFTDAEAFPMSSEAKRFLFQDAARQFILRFSPETLAA